MLFLRILVRKKGMYIRFHRFILFSFTFFLHSHPPPPRSNKVTDCLHFEASHPNVKERREGAHSLSFFLFVCVTKKNERSAFYDVRASCQLKRQKSNFDFFFIIITITSFASDDNSLPLVATFNWLFELFLEIELLTSTRHSPVLYLFIYFK